MSSVQIPQYCGITGCWNLAVIDGKDELNHPYHACSVDHADKIRTFRAELYAEGEKLAQYWRENWKNYVRRSKFGA